uniref:Uncharacterized protein n=1 Tax=Podoviridae sp. ct8Lf7 TaxID=2827723 RepID=A0A8S5S1L5_9CAUD|nr:MAG TPA: hypothetical protein [Podoviridae sp. ct8Lf7]
MTFYKSKVPPDLSNSIPNFFSLTFLVSPIPKSLPYPLDFYYFGVLYQYLSLFIFNPVEGLCTFLGLYVP